MVTDHKSFFEVVDGKRDVTTLGKEARTGVHVGAVDGREIETGEGFQLRHHRKRGPFQEAMQPIGSFLKAVVVKKKAAAAFAHGAKDTTSGRKQKQPKRGAAIRDRETLRYLFDVCCIEQLRDPENPVFAANLAEIDKARAELDYPTQPLEPLNKAFPILGK